MEPNSSQKEFTVLTLGITGVGKSTFINSIANYLSFETLEEAINGTPHCIIPTKFLIQIKEPNQRGFTKLNIEIHGQNGTDTSNEFSPKGKSATQAPRSYSFIQDNIKINIIDVPGIGDTGGINIDEKNKIAIIEKISKFPEIHAVWIMVHATANRATLEFLYSLNDIFSAIPKNAIENISFVITHSKASNFVPQNTIEALEDFVETLNSQQTLNIDVNNTIFCVDNESFRFQVAYYSNKVFKNHVDTILTDEFKKHHYGYCWMESRKSIMGLLDKMLRARGEPSTSFLAINRARILIPCFLNAAAKILHVIEKNKSSSFRAELKNNLMKGREIQNDINVKKEKLPQLVCASPRCIKWTTKPDGSKIFEFTQVCHNDCRLTNVVYGKMPQDTIVNCQVFNIDNICTKCGCSYAVHTHIHYNFQNILRSQKIRPKTEAESDAYIQSFLDQLDKTKVAIIMAFTIAYRYLHQHAILTYNNTLIERLNMEIRNQNSSREKDEEVINNLKTILEEHQKLIRTLQNIRNIQLQKSVTYEEFETAINDVFKLPPFGTKIKEIYDSERDSASQYNADFEPLSVAYIPKV